mmetsp:Transcript_1348/g.3028  ORF Transcript_1348/g.3028 Transcript_1348/m.3028 type:complete len:314 (-) Transcript_1348:187-1128(-)
MLTTLARLRRPRLALGATRAPMMRAVLSLSDSAGPPRPRFDPLGRPLHELTEAEAKEAKDAEAKEEGGRRGERGEAEEGIDAPSSARSPRQPWGSFARPDRSDQGGGFGGRGGGGGFGGSGFGRGRGHGSPPADADMMTFQAYVRQRLGQMDEERFPAKRSTQALAELAFLEEQVAEDEMHRKRRKLRDPLAETPSSEITHTNLPLLNRFVSDNGTILPRKLTGVQLKKQKRIARAIKRAQQLALMPKIWKLPQYRHANYADDFSRSEREVQGNHDEDFQEPADLRYPGQLESAEPSLSVDLAWMAESYAKRK